MSSIVYAYLSVSDFTCAPEDVTALIGLPARRVRLIGERTREERPIDRNTWSSNPAIPPNEERPDHHVMAVLRHIENQPSELADFLRSHDSGINCVGEFRRLNGGFHMSKQLVARCANLGLWLDFDLYNYAADDEP